MVLHMQLIILPIRLDDLLKQDEAVLEDTRRVVRLLCWNFDGSSDTSRLDTIDTIDTIDAIDAL